MNQYLYLLCVKYIYECTVYIHLFKLRLHSKLLQFSALACGKDSIAKRLDKVNPQEVIHHKHRT